MFSIFNRRRFPNEQKVRDYVNKSTNKYIASLTNKYNRSLDIEKSKELILVDNYGNSIYSSTNPIPLGNSFYMIVAFGVFQLLYFLRCK